MIFRIILVSIVFILPITTSAKNQSPMAWPHFSAEQQQGLSIVQSLRQQNLLIRDPYLWTYVQRLGQHIAFNSDLKNRPFRFYLINEPSINAFALPGDIIVLHTGLIDAADNEDELAAVIAHEIAHLTQNHLERRSERTSEYQIPLTIATLLAIGLSGGDSQVTGAAISTLQAGSVDNFVNTTREFEYEADRIGFKTLISAGFSADGMVSFFEKLNQADTGEIPEYLRTHPLTLNRINEAKNRATQYKHLPSQQSEEFEFIKNYLEAYQKKQTEQFTKQTQADKSLVHLLATSDPTHLAYLKETNNRQVLTKALQISPFTGEIHTLLAKHYYEKQDTFNGQIHTALAAAYEGQMKRAGNIIRQLKSQFKDDKKIKALWSTLPNH